MLIVGTAEKQSEKQETMGLINPVTMWNRLASTEYEIEANLQF